MYLSSLLYKRLLYSFGNQTNIHICAIAETKTEMCSKELHNAQTHLWNHLYSFMNSQTLKCCVELGIPDVIYNHGKPMSLSELASALFIPPSRIPYLQRILNLLVHNDFFTEQNGVYALTPNSLLLVRSKPESMAPFIELTLDDSVIVPWSVLIPWLKSEQPSTAFEMYHGFNFWDATAKMPSLGKHTRQGLEADSGAVAKVILEDCADQFEGVKSLVEVAGVTGKIAKEVKKAFPGIKCTLFELPHVIDAIEKSDDIEYVAGDMFKGIPSADVLILKWVLMPWSDEECVKILTQCKKAVPSKKNGGKIIMVEKVTDIPTPDVEHDGVDQTKIYWDVQMMVHLTGKTRTEKEWKSLFDVAGFKEYKIIPALGMRCIIELYH